MELVNKTGEPIAAEQPGADGTVALDPMQAAEALPGTPPKEHEPRWFRRRAEVCNKEFDRLMRAFVDDMKQPLTPGVLRDVEAVRRHYGHEWAVFASKQMTVDIEPITLDKQGMYKAIDQMLDNSAKEERLHMPLAQLPNGLAEYEFRLVGECKIRGAVWMCSHLVVTVTKSGTVCVFPRAEGFELGLTTGNLMNYIDFAPPLLTKVDLSMHDLRLLLGALKVQRIAAPTEGECEWARTGVHVANA